MRVTFCNRLNIEERPHIAPRIHYTHSRRLNLKIFIDYQPSKISNPQKKQDVDWRINLEGDSATVSHMREIIVSEIITYLRQRVRSGFKALSFMDILALADMRSIH
ncbi:MAG: hypothetical protein J0L77_08725 [Alphaproteobacteria bacterium]|nr:hypothetical protein [Alphaproteobacteria bacterium]